MALLRRRQLGAHQTGSMCQGHGHRGYCRKVQLVSVLLFHHDYRERGVHREREEERCDERGKTDRMKEKNHNVSYVNQGEKEKTCLIYKSVKSLHCNTDNVTAIFASGAVVQ